ncbi:MAG: hypothetical protein KBD56_05675 [Candidatus Eisenbacteria bacterium]|nr:hypothetical protein [Candidatus Eisenbacteria bacterium]
MGRHPDSRPLLRGGIALLWLLSFWLALPHPLRAAEYAVVPGSRENALHLSFDPPASEVRIAIVQAPVWLRDIRVEIPEGTVSEARICFAVAPDAAVDLHGTLTARIEGTAPVAERRALDQHHPSGEASRAPFAMTRRWSLVAAPSAPARQEGYRIEECCLPSADVDVDPNGIPYGHQLAGAAPNPWRGAMRVRFGLAAGGAEVRLRIHDLSGRLVRAIDTPHLDAGFHQIVWDGIDEAGRSVAPGLYFYEIRAGEWSAMGKALLIR